MSLAKNQIIPLKVLSISSDGNGVGKFDGQAVFVPFSAPGDELFVKIVKPCSNYAFGIIDSIYKASEERITPDCNIFGKCGGCAFRHLNYSEELKQKQFFVENSFKRIAKLDVTINKILPSPKSERYRNKVQIPVYSDGNAACTGFYAGRSHRIVPCSDCMLQPQLFTEISKLLCKLIDEYNISIYDEEKHSGIMRHIFLRISKQENIMLCLVINAKKLPFEKEFVEKITAEFPKITSVVININREKTNVIMGTKCRTLFGTDYLCDEMSGVPVKLSPLSFYQVNTEGAEQLYAVASMFANLSKSDILLDLYCGTGTIGLSMARSCKELIGVEIIPQAIENAIQNAEQMQISNARFICADASKASKKLLNEGLSPDVIILDPPRKGCDEEGLNAVCKMNPRRIVMVSCNPSTAARDCAFLAQKGFTVSAVQPVDMFPRTKHVECVVLLSR